MCGPSDDKSNMFVKDYRRVISQVNKRFRFPKNYDKIVETGQIKCDGTDSDGNDHLKLVYGKENKRGYRPCYSLVRVVEYQVGSDYFYCTPYLTVFDDEIKLHASCYEPFGFSRLEIRKFLPLFELLKTDDTNNPYKLVNTKYVLKIGQHTATIEEESVNDHHEKKGKNGKLVYKTYYGKMDTTFYLIRDHNGKLELDKSILSFPVVLMSTLIKLCGLFLTYLPMKLGECLIGTQNSVARVFGCIPFVPAMVIKIGLDMGAIIGKVPILLFVANEKKYADSYWTLWKHEFSGCLEELKNDIILIKNGKRPESRDLDPDSGGYACGTWKELNALKRKLENMPQMFSDSDNPV